MKRNIISIAAAGVLTTVVSVLAAGSPAAFAAPFNGVSGEGYRCESGSRDPDPIPYNDSGSMRAIAQNNTVNPEFTDGISRFSYRVFLPLLRDSRENMNFSGPAEGDFPVHAERSLYQDRIEHHFGGRPRNS